FRRVLFRSQMLETSGNPPLIFVMTHFRTGSGQQQGPVNSAVNSGGAPSLDAGGKKEARVGENDFYVRFWGVRGSIAVGSPDVMRYGGNTSCLEIRCGRHLLIMDAGTGVRALGLALQQEAPVDADLFFTHTHYDHVCGLPHFCPFFDPRSKFNVYAGHVTDGPGIKGVLKQMMCSPLFPVPLEIFQAQITYTDFRQGDVLEPRPGVTVRTGPLSHPDLATGYRVESGRKSSRYLTATQRPPE